MRCIKQGILLSVVLFLLSPLAFALETVKVSNNGNFQAVLGKGDFNRLFVDKDRILNVMGTPNAYLIQTDNILGQVYIKPLQSQPFNLTLSTEKGKVYQLKVFVRQSGSETLELSPTDLDEDDPTALAEKNKPYETALVTLVQAMATDTFPDNYQVSLAKDPTVLHLGQVANLTLESQYKGQALEGDIYRLHNLTNSTLNLVPTQLYRPGSMAIALESEAIPAGSETRVFVIKGVS